jgi:hypothetical protein
MTMTILMISTKQLLEREVVPIRRRNHHDHHQEDASPQPHPMKPISPEQIEIERKSDGRVLLQKECRRWKRHPRPRSWLSYELGEELARLDKRRSVLE